jgi:hypothetical protein
MKSSEYGRISHHYRNYSSQNNKLEQRMIFFWRNVLWYWWFDAHDEKGTSTSYVLTDIQDKPKLSLLYVEFTAEIYQQMPEKEMLISRNLWFYRCTPILKKLVKALLEQIETIVKLIRSKGIGIYFITQNPMDVPRCPSSTRIKIQHALRALQPKTDNRSNKQDNYPSSDYYETSEI